jgi:FlaG/FlaF family flagellin (archaellin)
MGRHHILRKTNRMDALAVSEAIGTILMLAVTTVLVGAVAMWAATLGGVDEEVQVDFLSNIEYDGSDDIYYITHQGGETMKERDITIHVKHAPPSNPDQFSDISGSPFKFTESQGFKGNDVGTNAYWEVGETFSVKSTTAYSQTDIVMIQIIYISGDTQTIIMEATFEKRPPHG